MERSNDPVLKVLREGHGRLRSCLDRLDRTDLAADVAVRWLSELRDEVEDYLSARREVVYPVMRQIMDAQLQFAIDQQLMAFLAVDRELETLQRVLVEEPDWHGAIRGLRDKLDVCMRDDERDIFPFLRLMASGVFAGLGLKIEERRRHAA